jgi:hypothetical protein
MWIAIFFIFVWAASVWSPRSRRRESYGGYNYDPAAPYSSAYWPYVTSPSAHHRGRGPRGYKRIDIRILEDISDRLTYEDSVDASDIAVDVKEGVVRLSGSVGTRSEKRIAEAIADAVPGVIDVRNELTIGKAPAQQRAKAS